jgi:hypothetical protein
MASMLTRLETSGFSPMGTPKTLVYVAPVDNVEVRVIHHRTVDAWQTVCNTPASLI